MSEMVQTPKGGDEPTHGPMSFQDPITPHEIKDTDEALTFLRKEEVGDEGEYVDEKALIRKIDWMVMPLMFWCYLLEYLDKSLCKFP